MSKNIEDEPPKWFGTGIKVQDTRYMTKKCLCAI